MENRLFKGVLLSPYRKRCPLQSPERINNKERR